MNNSQARITLLIADSHSHYRQGLRQLCEINGGFRVVAEAESGEQLVALAQQFQPDVLLLDEDLPGLNRLDLAQRLTHLIPVVLLALFDTPRLRAKARQTGIWEVLPKDCDETVLFSAIVAVYARGQPGNESDVGKVDKSAQGTNQ